MTYAFRQGFMDKLAQLDPNLASYFRDVATNGTAASSTSSTNTTTSATAPASPPPPPPPAPTATTASTSAVQAKKAPSKRTLRDKAMAEASRLLPLFGLGLM